MELFNSMGVSDNFYSRIRRILLEYECITYLERGTKSYDTVLVLHHEPPENISPILLTSGRDGATLGDIPDLERRLRVLEDWRIAITGGTDIIKVMQNFEGRIATLESQLTEREIANGTKTPKNAKKA
jgi:hypothetical protein